MANIQVELGFQGHNEEIDMLKEAGIIPSTDSIQYNTIVSYNNKDYYYKYSYSNDMFILIVVLQEVNPSA